VSSSQISVFNSDYDVSSSQAKGAQKDGADNSVGDFRSSQTANCSPGTDNHDQKMKPVAQSLKS
jgi:hypothetical protein